MEFLRQIKIILISLYVIILGFIVFDNTSVFADEPQTELQTGVYEVSNGFDDYFIHVQDNFDYNAVNNSNQSGFARYYQLVLSHSIYWGIYVEPYSSYTINGSTYGEGYLVSFYVKNHALTASSNFVDATFSGYRTGQYDMTYKAVNIIGRMKMYVYHAGADYTGLTSYDANDAVAVPLCCINYPHYIINSYNADSNTSGATQITNAINNQTNTIANETQKQTNAITTATKEQTNALLDTNDTGNETMSVNDTTTDTSADLGGLFNQINSSFTDTTSETQKGFDLTLPNGDTHTFTLKANVLTSFLDNNLVLKAFYQAFFYVVFGGYVIFDFKKIINKLKEGNIDNVVGSSSPVDSVVNMSLK